jgi:hypothetical protein
VSDTFVEGGELVSVVAGQIRQIPVCDIFGSVRISGIDDIAHKFMVFGVSNPATPICKL